MPDPKDPKRYADAIDMEIAGILDDESKPGEAFDFSAYADGLTRELEERGARHLDPPDETYWRDVVVELRRRSIRPV